MLPKMLPSTCRALGSMAETLLRRAGMPLEPPVKNTVLTCSTPTPASPSSFDTLSRTRSSCESMAASNHACQVDAQARFDAVQCHQPVVGVGQLDLGFFHFHRQPVACALLDQLEQTVDAAGVFDVVTHAAQGQLGFL